MLIESTFLGLTVVTEIEMLMGDLEETGDLLRQCLGVVSQQKGFKASALHRCVDEARWLLYAQWDSWEDWNSSLFSSAFEHGPGARLWELINQGQLRLRPTVYEVMATA